MYTKKIWYIYNIQYMCISQSDHHSLVNIDHCISVIHWCDHLSEFFLKMRTFKLYSLQFSNMQLSIINCSHHAIHHIPRTFYFITGTFNFCSPPIPHLCQIRKLICFLYLWVQFWVCFFFKDPTCKWNYTVLSFCQTYFT